MSVHDRIGVRRSLQKVKRDATLSAVNGVRGVSGGAGGMNSVTLRFNSSRDETVNFVRFLRAPSEPLERQKLQLWFLML